MRLPTLLQAVERVRITVQLRRLASKKGGSGAQSFKCEPRAVPDGVCGAARDSSCSGGPASLRMARCHGPSAPPRCIPLSLPRQPTMHASPRLLCCSLSMDAGSTGGMTREAMRRALEELQSNGVSRRATSISEASSESGGLM